MREAFDRCRDAAHTTDRPALLIAGGDRGGAGPTMTQTLRVVQAFDRTLIAEVAADDGDALEKKLVAAAKAMRNRDGWLKPHQRSAVLQRAASLLEARQEPFVTLIAREGGKPVSDAAVEVIRAIDGLRNAAEALRTFAGREIPMGLTPASERRWAFTTKEPIGVVAAISAFNHPLNLIVHQVAPAIAVGCPVIVKPAAATPLSCLELVKLLPGGRPRRSVVPDLHHR